LYQLSRTAPAFAGTSNLVLYYKAANVWGFGEETAPHVMLYNRKRNLQHIDSLIDSAFSLDQQAPPILSRTCHHHKRSLMTPSVSVARPDSKGCSACVCRCAPSQTWHDHTIRYLRSARVRSTFASIIKARDILVNSSTRMLVEGINPNHCCRLRGYATHLEIPAFLYLRHTFLPFHIGSPFIGNQISCTHNQELGTRRSLRSNPVLGSLIGNLPKTLASQQTLQSALSSYSNGRGNYGFDFPSQRH